MEFSIFWRHLRLYWTNAELNWRVVSEDDLFMLYDCALKSYLLTVPLQLFWNKLAISLSTFVCCSYCPDNRKV